MAFQCTWYPSELPENLIKLIEKEVTDESTIPENSWVSGYIWHYISKANRENFNFELSHLDGNSLQYKVYNEGDHQSWHTDAKPLDSNDEEVRKISFIVQLSDVDDYEGGNVQFLDGNGSRYFIPRRRGMVALFDSETTHRVLRVTKGTRKALVGWCVGPRWK